MRVLHGLVPGGEGGTSLYEGNSDVLLDGVTFSIALVEWGCTFADFWGKRVQDLRLANIPECLYCR